jgi:hypothetical protein
MDAVFGTEDPARSRILPQMDPAALLQRQAAVVTRAHGAELAMNTHLLALEACALSRSETVVADSVSDASLLAKLTLHNWILLLFLRGGLANVRAGAAVRAATSASLKSLMVFLLL